MAELHVKYKETRAQCAHPTPNRFMRSRHLQPPMAGARLVFCFQEEHRTTETWPLADGKFTIL